MHSVCPHELLLWNALGNMQTSQEYFTIVYAKFGGQTECIMDNWKIVNKRLKKVVMLFLTTIKRYYVVRVQHPPGKRYLSLILYPLPRGFE